MTPDDPRHGKKAGYDAHRRDGEDACAQCLRAAARYEKGRLLDQTRGHRRTVPSIGTARRVQGLVAMGWNFGQIADEIGTAHDQARKLAIKTDTYVRSVTAARVSEVYDRLSMRLPPTDTPAQRRITGYARTVARRYGWVPPLAWDDDTIDDPATVPAGGYQPVTPARDTNGDFTAGPGEPVDEVAVRRILNGDWRLSCSKADKVAVVAAWTGGINELARLTGWKVERYTTREDVPA